MKTTILLIAFSICLSLSAQDIKPKYEQERDMVKATYFHDNGEIAQVGYYLDGKLHDLWSMYDDQGEKIAMGQYQMGKRTGKWYFWNKEEIKEVDFADNKIVNVVKYQNKEALVIKK